MTNLKYFALSWDNDLFGHLWCNLVHFVAFCSSSCATPWSLHDLFWLLSPFRCPSNLEIDHVIHVGHSGPIWKSFALSCYFDHSGLFWTILVQFMGDPTTPLYWIFTKSSKKCILCTKNFYAWPAPPSKLNSFRKYWSNKGSFPSLKWKKATATFQVGLVMVWSRSWPIITKVGRCSLEYN